jgi:mRNA interferase HigB
MPLSRWCQIVKKATWRSIQEVRRVYPHADSIIVASRRVVTVFNVGGNKYRVIVALHYNRQKVFILQILSHAEYNKGVWKETL